MTPKQLKNSILQRAIEGRLVPQCTDDGTADELLSQIRIEKEQLIADGKLKREKTLPPIDEKELPFAIPASWRWVRLGEILNISSGDGLASKDMIKGDIPVYGGNGITGYHNEANLHKEAIVIGRVGFYCGSIHVTEKEAWVTDNAFITTYPEKNIYRDYLVYILGYMNLGKNNNATAQPVVSGKKIYPLLFPLPPLAEQKRIVAKINELMPLLDRYEPAYNKLTVLDTKFPDQLKKSLLQYAIQGKLVPQCAADGTAGELLTQIRAEKEQLIADGKIKQEKPLPPIDEKELPFAIPASWRWTRLGEMIQLVSGRDLTPQQYNSNGEGIPYITGASNIDEEGNIIVNRWTKFSKSIAYKDDLLLSCKGTVGKTTILSLKEAHIARQIMSIRPYINIINYVLLFLSFQVDELKSKAKSMIPGIERKDVLYAPIPLPPLDEQKRIVAKIDELMARVGRLTKVVN